MQIRLTTLCIMVVFLYAPLRASEDDQRLWAIVQATSVDDRTAIASKGMSIEEINDESVAGIIDSTSINNLVSEGFIIQESMPLNRYLELSIDSQITRANYQFSSFQGMVEKLKKLGTAHSDIATLSSIGQSCEGRDLWLLKLSSAHGDSSRTAKPGILFLGTHHAREHISTEVCLSLASYLCEHKKDPAIVTLLNSIDIYIMPMLNPDGVVYDFSKSSFACWRKNRRINQDRTIGVDLNRNYSYMWSGPGKVTTPSSESYSGPRPFSEPETQALRSFLESHNNIKIFISYHSFGKLILYPWGCTNTPVENQRDRNVYLQLAQKMATILGYKAMSAAALYVAPGDAVDWAYGEHKIFAFSVELMPQGGSGCGAFYPTNQQAINDDIAKNIEAAVYLCNICTDPYKVLVS